MIYDLRLKIDSLVKSLYLSFFVIPAPHQVRGGSDGKLDFLQVHQN